MSEPVRLSKRLIELLGCSRREAEIYIQGGWVLVDGVVVDSEQYRVLDHVVTLDPEATLEPIEPATILLYKPAGIDADAAIETLSTSARSSTDLSGIRPLQRHFTRLSAILPLETAAAGLQPYSQDGRSVYRMREDAERIEQEYTVEVSGSATAEALQSLGDGLTFKGRPLPPVKVSWQSENRLRFALKGLQPGQLEWLCADIGLKVLAIKRIRIGRIALAKMAPGEWRFLPAQERF